MKAPNPVSRVEQQLSPWLRLCLEFCHLKHVYRSGWLQRGLSRERGESVADHTAGVALLAMVLAAFDFPDLDLKRVLLLSLVHDLGEIGAGDITPSDRVASEEKSLRERVSVRRLFEDVAEGAQWIALWEDYEKADTPEAKFVRDVDKLEMSLQALAYEIDGFGELSDFFASAGENVVDERLRKRLAEIVECRPKQAL